MAKSALAKASHMGVAVTVLSFVTGCGGGGGSTTTTQVGPPPPSLTTHSTCSNEWPGYAVGELNGPFKLGQYLIANNGFGMHQISSGTECMNSTLLDSGGITATWNWSLVSQQGNETTVKGYQEVIYGQTPSRPDGNSTVASLPVSVASVSASLAANIDMSVSATGAYNTLLEMYLGPSKSVKTVNTELMIIPNIIGPGTSYDRSSWPQVTIGGVNYWVNTTGVQACTACVNGVATWQGIQFYAQTPTFNASFPIKAFVDYVVSKGWIDSGYYLFDVEFGTENDDGSGSVTLKSYSVTP